MSIKLLLVLLGVSQLSYGKSHIHNTSVSTPLSRWIETRACVACELHNSDLSWIDLSGVDLSGANQNGSKLHLANLRGANLLGASLLNISQSVTTLSSTDLRNADLSDIDIDQAFEYVEIIDTQFEGPRFKHGVVCGPAPVKDGWGCQQL